MKKIIPALFLVACGATSGESTDTTRSSLAFLTNSYYVRTLGSRCLDFGGQAWWTVGAPVSLYTCNGTVAQQVRVIELDATHDVQLRVPDGSFCLGVRGNTVTPGAALELEDCAPDANYASQRFALDGDSIMMGAQSTGKVTREFVIEPRNDASPNHTPLVVGTRETSDAEYFRMQAVDGSSAQPTRGFVTVSLAPAPNYDASLGTALGGGWGTVIEIDPSQEFVITKTQEIPAGVTVRGYRKHRNTGAIVRYGGASGAMFKMAQDGARLTGLRLIGPETVSVKAVDVFTDVGQRVLVDHNELTGWPDAAINVTGGDAPCHLRPAGTCDDNAPPDEGTCFSATQYAQQFPLPRPTNVRILRNLVHDNPGYGIVTGDGAFILAQGNVEYRDQHQLAADPWRLTGYAAYDNFTMGPTVNSGERESNQDFDSHGSLHPGSWYDGIAGDYFDIGWNTFLQTSHYDFNQRGTPCRYTTFHNNVSTQAQSGAFLTRTTNPSETFVGKNNAWSQNPMNDLGVGDFDGDQVDDVFVGTGVTWWYSSGGQSEWRLLNRMPEHASQLRFGDFDGDGRTDVIALHGPNVDISWTGASPWQTVSTLSWPLADLAVGDFDGDHVSDLFLSTGTEWLIAPAAGNWQVLAFETLPTSALRFGDFTADGKTDIFAVVNNDWQIFRGGGASFEFWNKALTSSVAGLVVADFDGDGYADVARSITPQNGPAVWQYSARAIGGFIDLRVDSNNVATLPIGHFDLDTKADALQWDSYIFDLVPGPQGTIAPLSLQAMR
jgi:hypothetical protein